MHTVYKYCYTMQRKIFNDSQLILAINGQQNIQLFVIMTGYITYSKL